MARTRPAGPPPPRAARTLARDRPVCYQAKLEYSRNDRARDRAATAHGCAARRGPARSRDLGRARPAPRRCGDPGPARPGVRHRLGPVLPLARGAGPPRARRGARARDRGLRDAPPRRPAGQPDARRPRRRADPRPRRPAGGGRPADDRDRRRRPRRFSRRPPARRGGGGTRPGGRDRPWRRHGAGADAAGLRAVRHHQGPGQGHRARGSRRSTASSDRRAATRSLARRSPAARR